MQTLNDILTNSNETQHFVDNETVSTEMALEKFRSLFPLTRLNVWNPTKGMSYSIKHGRFSHNFLRDAERIIKAANLPLRASIKKMFIEDILVIEAK